MSMSAMDPSMSSMMSRARAFGRATRACASRPASQLSVIAFAFRAIARAG